MTSHDVARAAGVSQSTVSRVLRGDARVAPDLRERVEQAAASLAYVPNSLARGMVQRRTGAVGVVVSDVTNPFYNHLLQSVHSELSAGGYRMVLIVDPIDAPSQLADYESLLDRTLDGVIITTAMEESGTPAELVARGLAVVLAVRGITGNPVDTVVSDNVRGAEDAAEFVLSRGHRHVGVVLGPPTTSTSRERARGYAAAFARYGLAVPDALRRYGPYTYEAGFAHASELLGRVDRPTALVCGNDVLAIGAYEAARRLRLDVPGDVSIIGFDDIPMAGWESFRLTTMHQDIPGIARRAAQRLMRRIEGATAAPSLDRFPARLVVRDSVAEPSRSAAAG